MLHEAKNLLEKTQEVMDLCMGQILDADMLAHTSAEGFELYKKYYELMEMSKKLVLEQARLMDDIDAKLDKITMLLETRN